MEKLPITYIAHPISGNVEGNLRLIREIVRNVAIHENIIPFVPYYVYCVSLDDNSYIERRLGMDFDHAILRSGIVNQLWLYGFHVSDGMKDEIQIAREEDIPVFAKTDQTLEWLKYN